MLLAAVPAPASAKMVDKGVVMRLEGLYDASSVAVSEHKGQRVMWLDGTPTLRGTEAGGLYFSAQNGNSWTKPRPSFSKPGYMIRRPAVFKHPKLNRHIMFYTMRPSEPVREKRRDPKTGKEHTVTHAPMDVIGVAYASPCGSDAPDGSGLCWHDLSAEAPLIGANNGFNNDGGGNASVFLSGAQVHVYYRTNAPSARLLRTIVDLRDWSRVETKPLTVQVAHPIKKTWRLLEPHEQISMVNPSVTPLDSGGYTMLAGDGSSYALGRWKSEDGINFYRDPEPGAALHNPERAVFGAPSFEYAGKNELLVYYALGDGKDACSQARSRVGGHIPCLRMIEARRMKEE
jgi:hypothetical protein